MVATLNQPNAISYPFAENGDKNAIPVTNDGSTGAASQSLGFPAITSTAISSGGIPPSRKDFNGIFNLVTGQYFYLQNGGKFTFDQDVSDAIGGYPEGAILSYTDQDNHVYQVVSLVGNNTYNFVTTPSYIDDVHWAKAYNDDLSNYMTYNVLSLIYPVGSVYQGTQETCPMEELISGSTWTLRASKIVTNVSSTVAVKGTGKTLGLTNGNSNVGMSTAPEQDVNLRLFNRDAFNVNVQTTGSTAAHYAAGGMFGVVTDATKSGLTGTATSTTFTVNIWERTA